MEFKCIGCIEKQEIENTRDIMYVAINGIRFRDLKSWRKAEGEL